MLAGNWVKSSILQRSTALLLALSCCPDVHVLRNVCGPSVNETIAHSPELLSADLCTWLDFLSGLGVPSPMIAKVGTLGLAVGLQVKGSACST